MMARPWTAAIVCCFLGGVGLTAIMAGTGAKRHHHKAHVHGAALLNIAIEDRAATVEFESPAEGVIGFEYEAKSEADRTKQAMALDTLRDNIHRMVIFDPALGCRFSPTKVDVVRQDQQHAEVHGLFAVSCDVAPAASTLRFGVTKTFPRIHTVKVQVVGATQQAGATIKRDQGALEVPR
jgi:hypothetical protein